MARIDTTLASIISVGLNTRKLNSAQAASLLYIRGSWASALPKEILERAINEGVDRAAAIAEELARDATLEHHLNDGELVSLIGKYGAGEWTKRLLMQQQCSDGLSAQRVEEDVPASHHWTQSEVIGSYDWQAETLVEPQQLEQAAERVLAHSRAAGEHFSFRRCAYCGRCVGAIEALLRLPGRSLYDL